MITVIIHILNLNVLNVVEISNFVLFKTIKYGDSIQNSEYEFT